MDGVTVVPTGDGIVQERNEGCCSSRAIVALGTWGKTYAASLSAMAFVCGLMNTYFRGDEVIAAFAQHAFAEVITESLKGLKKDKISPLHWKNIAYLVGKVGSVYFWGDVVSNLEDVITPRTGIFLGWGNVSVLACYYSIAHHLIDERHEEKISNEELLHRFLNDPKFATKIREEVEKNLFEVVVDKTELIGEKLGLPELMQQLEAIKGNPESTDAYHRGHQAWMAFGHQLACSTITPALSPAQLVPDDGAGASANLGTQVEGASSASAAASLPGSVVIDDLETFAQMMEQFAQDDRSEAFVENVLKRIVRRRAEAMGAVQAGVQGDVDSGAEDRSDAVDVPKKENCFSWFLLKIKGDPSETAHLLSPVNGDLGEGGSGIGEAALVEV